MPGPPDGGRNPYKYPIGDDRSQIQRIISSNLKKIPGMESVGYEESGTGVETQIVATPDTAVFANGIIEPEEASIQVNWWPLDSGDEDYWYQFHYTDSSGFDCGWHRQENPHVGGLDHYQERQSSDEEYEYSEFSPEFRNPAGLVWEIVDGRLVERLKIRYTEG